MIFEQINCCNLRKIIILISLMCIIWIPIRTSARLRSRHIDFHKHPPCFFNHLCTCSRTYPDFGIVRCKNIPFYRIPQAIINSKLFVLHLSNNNLYTISAHFLKLTGLYRLEIINNPLVKLPNEAFSGLERSLWELELKYDQLLEVPSRAMRYLQKLRRLDLTGNEISKIERETWRGLENSLEELILANNQINFIPSQTFSSLLNLIVLDLSDNNLRYIETNTFENGLEKLAHLSLSNNLMESIPYRLIISLNNLKILDLSFNQIRSMFELNSATEENIFNNYRMSLNILKLDYNQINVLETGSLQYFDIVNITIFDGNPLTEIQTEAFQGVRIRELYFKNCEIKEIAPNAFSGLENYLETIDLSENNLKNVSSELFHNFNYLKSVSLRDNPMLKIHLSTLFVSNQHSLSALDLSGIKPKGFNFDNLKKLRSIRKLHLSFLPKVEIIPELFEDFSIDINDLKVSYSQISALKNHAFAYIHSLINLDLSDNKINKIEKNAFIDIGNSLKTLKISNGLDQKFISLNVNLFQYLIYIEHLDLSNNNIHQVPDRTFHYLKCLKVLKLQDNKIEEIIRGSFQGDIHIKLEDVNLAFNSIRRIQQHTFVDLMRLKSINLQDNRIASIDRRSFMNLDELNTLNLKGNKILKISKEAFQNIPELEILDLSFNLITQFDFSIFDQVGTLSKLKVNFSHNAINSLTTSNIGQIDMAHSNGYYINIKCLDLSNNNISMINRYFFKPIEVSIMEIFLQENKLYNLSREVFANMPHLQLLDLSRNNIYEINFDTFKNSPKLQILNLAFNQLKELPAEVLQGLLDLKIIDLSHNHFKSIHDNLFQSDGFESINLSHNMLLKIPFNSISTASGATLCHLDLSYNLITTIPYNNYFTKLQSLVILNLEHNNIGLLNESTFANVPNLLSLDLSNNAELELKRYGNSFKGIENSLMFLNLNNVSLMSIPDLPLLKLRHLSLANNVLPTIPPEISTNLTSLRSLNLSHNDLTSVPIVIHSLSNLRTLILKNNPISSISNHSFIGLSETVNYLDIRNLLLTSFENGALTTLIALRKLKISVYRFIKDISVPELIENNIALRRLEINVENDVKLTSKTFEGFYPTKLSTITLEGTGIDNIPDNTFKGMQSSKLNLVIWNTKLKKISKKLFENMAKVRNITIDLRNNKLEKFENPSTGVRIGESKSIFLIDLKMAFNPWKCDCSIGWVEFWQRKMRQYLSAKYPEEDDIRETRCVNRGNITLSEILKIDLECGWGKGISKYNISIVLLLLIMFVTYILN